MAIVSIQERRPTTSGTQPQHPRISATSNYLSLIPTSSSAISACSGHCCGLLIPRMVRADDLRNSSHNPSLRYLSAGSRCHVQFTSKLNMTREKRLKA
ncbi:hypothetical protein BY996DRAFT_6479706 [Phakopsora pachyrhizi]|nr:hypothetical protein BY996DRAFT_6479706 [Phakopsora pachyrhizi]